MIRFRNLVFEDYFIDEHTAVITDKYGNVVEQHCCLDYMYVNIGGNGRPVHQIQAHTKWGYRKGNDVHHKDDNKLNNDVDNLDYTMTRGGHMRITKTGKKRDDVIKRNKDIKRGNTFTKGRKWYNDGIRNYMAFECPKGCVPGKIKN